MISTALAARLPRPAVALVTMMGGLAAVAGALWVVTADRQAPADGALAALAVSGAGAIGGGLVTVAVAHRRRRAGASGEPVRALLGLAAVVWGVGQCVLVVDTGPDGVRPFASGDLFGLLAAPLVVAGLLRIPRRSRASRPTLRLGLDAALLGLSTTTAVWWILLAPQVPAAERGGSPALPAAVATLIDLLILALCLLVRIRERRPGTLALVLGLALHSTADITQFRAVLGAQVIPWQVGVLWSLAIPVITAGLVRLATSPPGTDLDDVVEDLGETRSTTVATVISFGTLAVVFGMPIPYRWVGLGGVLQGLVAVVAVARELMVGRIRARLIRRLGEEALRDALTGLPNRRALTARIRTLDLAEPWVLLVVDLDDFKEVNDLLGPEAGDSLLVEIAHVLTAKVPARGLVARMGGDEFGVLAPGDLHAGERLAERLAEAVRGTAPAQAGFPLSASIGVGRVLPETAGAVPCRSAHGVSRSSSSEPESAPERAPENAPESAADDRPDDSPHDGPHRTAPPAAVPALLEPRHDRLSALIESAAAVRAAKAAGRGRIAVYPGAVEQARQRRLVLEWRLRDALDAGRLRMHAQPLVDLRSGQVRGFESLARWTDDVLGVVSPSEFVPVAEQTGLVTALGEFALRFTLEQVRATGLLGRDVEVGVNVSPIQLRQPRFAARVSDLVDELDLPPRRLLLEVTEAILVDEDDPAAGTLAELAAAGIRLAIDDFGTGYSALGYLRRLPLDVLKVDRSWVLDSVGDPRTRRIVNGVIELAHQLGVTVVMEGVEDGEVAARCRDLGADVGQGWFFGQPIPWTEAVTGLETGAQVGSRTVARQAAGTALGPELSRD